MNYCSKRTVKMQYIVHKCLTGSVDLKRVEPPLKATPAQEAKKKVMLLPAPNGQTIKKEFYLEFLRRLHESVCQKRPQKWWDGDWILHHDSVPAHTSHLVQQPPYSPDITPRDFFLFPMLKKVLKGHRFEATEDIKRNSMKTLLDVPKEVFAKCFQQWQKRWVKCVAAEWNYVEDS
jgi:hypothetical protein